MEEYLLPDDLSCYLMTENQLVIGKDVSCFFSLESLIKKGEKIELKKRGHRRQKRIAWRWRRPLSPRGAYSCASLRFSSRINL